MPKDPPPQHPEVAQQPKDQRSVNEDALAALQEAQFKKAMANRRAAKSHSMIEGAIGMVDQMSHDFRRSSTHIEIELHDLQPPEALQPDLQPPEVQPEDEGRAVPPRPPPPTFKIVIFSKKNDSGILNYDFS